MTPEERFDAHEQWLLDHDKALAQHERWLAAHEAAGARHDAEMAEIRAILLRIAQLLEGGERP